MMNFTFLIWCIKMPLSLSIIRQKLVVCVDLNVKCLSRLGLWMTMGCPEVLWGAGQMVISHMSGIDWMQKSTVMEESMVGIQTLVSHYKYPPSHRVSARRENKNIFFLCFSKFKEKNVCRLDCRM